MAIASGAQVMAAYDGTVSYAGWKGDYGYLVAIDHGNGVFTKYAHNRKLLVEVGQTVSKYDIIAESGNTGHSTGPHVHFEIIFDKINVNPLDYMNQ
jgi:murein DD-endopeptidase MepM/ murein hydrolase activator NlpD